MMTHTDATVFIVDDDEAMREGLSLLMSAVNLKVKTFDSAQAFLDFYDQSQAGCLLLDVRMPGMSGLKLQDKLAERGINIPIIFITCHGDLPMAVEAVEKGAIDFLQKPVSDQTLLDKVQEALVIDIELRRKQAEREAMKEKLALLTPRERQVLELVKAGKLNKVIAHELGLSQRTVEVHRAGIMEKMEVDSLAELITLANTAHHIE
jgi:two-component system response regulator FixJ